MNKLMDERECSEAFSHPQFVDTSLELDEHYYKERSLRLLESNPSIVGSIINHTRSKADHYTKVRIH